MYDSDKGKVVWRSRKGKVAKTVYQSGARFSGRESFHVPFPRVLMHKTFGPERDTRRLDAIRLEIAWKQRGETAFPWHRETERKVTGNISNASSSLIAPRGTILASVPGFPTAFSPV